MTVYICKGCESPCILVVDRYTEPDPDRCPWGLDWAKWEIIDVKENEKG